MGRAVVVSSKVKSVSALLLSMRDDVLAIQYAYDSATYAAIIEMVHQLRLW